MDFPNCVELKMGEFQSKVELLSDLCEMLYRAALGNMRQKDNENMMLQAMYIIKQDAKRLDLSADELFSEINKI